MAHRIEIGFREGIRDALGEKIKRRINEHLHLPVEAVRTVEVYTLDGEFSREELERAAAGPLSDAVTQRYAIDAAVAAARPAAEAAAETTGFTADAAVAAAGKTATLPGANGAKAAGETAAAATVTRAAALAAGSDPQTAATAEAPRPVPAAGAAPTTDSPAAEAAWDFDWLIEVGFRPGVTDNVGKTAREAIAVLLGIPTGGAAAPGIAATAASATALSSPPAAPGAADGLLTGDYSDSLSVDKDNDSTAAGAPTATATPREDRPSGAAGEAASAPASDHADTPAPAPRPFRVHTSRQYLLRGALSRDEAERVASQLLANDLIERYEVVARADWDPVRGLPPFVPRVTGAERPTTELIDLDVADDALSAISNDRVLALTLEEMQLLRDYFRNPAVQAERARVGLPAAARITDAELECLAQTWSEHCKHKIFNSRIAYDDGTGRITEIDSLFKTYIKGATERIRAARTARGAVDFCLSVFVDNAGVIRFNDDYNLVFKVETHNSPSALDPYGGALTGIVGVNRDPFGTGMGAKLIFNTDVFCFAPPDYDRPLPKRILHPRRIYEGVREGVEHGGNKSGIPTVNGCLVFDERYLGKPLVYCGTGGIMPARLHGKPSHIKEILPGDLIVMTGGRIGKDGIHGATFSSEELHEGSPVTAVQIGDPITQKKMTDFLLVARDRGLYRCITDNGAGGLSSSVGETARLSGGCDLDLKRAPLKYPGLNPWEILISESQERMTLAVPPERIAAFLALAAKMDVEATVLGTYTDTGMFHIRYGGETVAYLDMDFLHDGLPQMRLRARWERPRRPEPDLPAPTDLGAALRRMLSRLNICSKESVVRQYDHEVQGGSVVKPLVGVANDGPGDAAVLRPLLDTFEGIVVANGICPRYSDIDAYDMAACAIDEAVRNAVAVGADPDYLAGLDNFCWCDPVASEKTPDGEYKLAQLVRANQAVYDYTTAYGVPCISGKDSMKNDYAIEGTKISIPPTLLFSVLGRIADVRRAVTMDAKRAGDIVYVLGETKNELGGSEWYALHGCVGDNCPRVDAAAARRLYAALHRAMTAGLVASCHDCSDGGLGIALAETAFAGGLGMEVELGKVPRRGLDRDDYVLFSETASRFVVTVAPDKREEFEATMREIRGDTSHISPATGSGEATAGETLTGMAEVPTIKVPTIAEKSPEPPPVVFAAVGVVTDEPLLTIRGLAGEIILHEPLAELKAAWQQPLP